MTSRGESPVLEVTDATATGFTIHDLGGVAPVGLDVAAILAALAAEAICWELQ